MPELPEVETMRRGIASIRGARIDNIVSLRCRKKPIQVSPSMPTIRRRVRGATILAVDRWGKRVILVLDNQFRLVIEPRMTGLLLIRNPPDSQYLRYAIRFGDGRDDLLFWDQRGLGTLSLYNQPAFEQRFDSSRLGPDALEISVQQLRDNLNRRKIPVKQGLLDQQAVAGVGNIYASEILFLAGVDPRTACNRLRKKAWPLIHQQMVSVLNQAIQLEGSSLRDGTYRNSLNESGSYQNHHRVYGREGLPCTQCGSTNIRRVILGQRSTYFCGKCQR